MIRCRWCGSDNYAIDQWCSNCSGHLDWGPKAASAAATEPGAQATAAPAVDAQAYETNAHEPVPAAPPRHHRRRPAVAWLLPAAAAAVVALLLALPVAGWFRASDQQAAGGPALPDTTALSSASSTPGATAFASPTPSPIVEATPTPEAPAPTATPMPQTVAPLPAPPAAAKNAGDPAAAVAGFYQNVAAHQFGNAAALWSGRMRADYPPPTFIDHRFASTRQMDLRGVQVVSNNGSVAVVSIDLVEVMDGATRHWVGTWQLVATSSGWLLNQPNLRSA